MGITLVASGIFPAPGPQRPSDADFWTLCLISRQLPPLRLHHLVLLPLWGAY